MHGWKSDLSRVYRAHEDRTLLKISVHDNMHQPQRREDCPALSFSLLIYYDREPTAINCRVCVLVDVTVCHVHRQTIDEDNLEGLLVKRVQY